MRAGTPGPRVEHCPGSDHSESCVHQQQVTMIHWSSECMETDPGTGDRGLVLLGWRGCHLRRCVQIWPGPRCGPRWGSCSSPGATTACGWSAWRTCSTIVLIAHKEGTFVSDYIQLGALEVRVHFSWIELELCKIESYYLLFVWLPSYLCCLPFICSSVVQSVIILRITAADGHQSYFAVMRAVACRVLLSRRVCGNLDY